jgi:hypothetical protein
MGAAEDVEAEGQGFKQVGKDLFAGACGGIAQVLLGQSLIFLLYKRSSFLVVLLI